MDEIRDAIRVLAKHNFRSMSNVVGEYVEKQIALVLGGVQTTHCMKGFDVLCQRLGKVEVKSRNAEAKSLRCTLPDHKLAILDNFILAIVRCGEIEKVMLFNKQTLLSLRVGAGAAYIDRRHFGYAEDITQMFRVES